MMNDTPKPRFFFKIPRVVPDQKSKFESDVVFQRLSVQNEIRYTGYQELPEQQRQDNFQHDCREGRTQIAFVASGTNLHLVFDANQGPLTQERECDFDKEHGKVHIKSHFIMNGVCVNFRGWLDLEHLDGVRWLEYDAKRAFEEMLSYQIDTYNKSLPNFEDKQKSLKRVERPQYNTEYMDAV